MLKTSLTTAALCAALAAPSALASETCATGIAGRALTCTGSIGTLRVDTAPLRASVNGAPAVLCECLGDRQDRKFECELADGQELYAHVRGRTRNSVRGWLDPGYRVFRCQ